MIEEYPRFGLLDPDRDTGPPEGVSYPMWIKPVKSASSELAFGVVNQQEFHDAVKQIRDGISRMGAPFETVLDYLELPPEIANVGGQVCLAEEAISGRQLTFEGYRYRGETHTLGVVDSVRHEESPSFVRYQYPAAIPDRVAQRMADISDRVVRQVEFEHATFNIEFFWDENTDALYVLEVNPRHSQSHAELFDQVDGAPNHLAMLRLALGRDPELPRRRGPYQVAAKWFLRHWNDGVVRRHPTELEIEQVQREIPGIRASTMFAHTSCPPDPAVVGERWRQMWHDRLTGSGLWLEKWLRHQRRDSYWQHGSVCENFADIAVPVYAVSGWADGYSNAVFRLLAELDVPRQGLIGPWSHKYPHLGQPGPAIGVL